VAKSSRDRKTRGGPLALLPRSNSTARAPSAFAHIRSWSGLTWRQSAPANSPAQSGLDNGRLQQGLGLASQSVHRKRSSCPGADSRYPLLATAGPTLPARSKAHLQGEGNACLQTGRG